MTETRKPADTIRDHEMKITIWCNEYVKDGRARSFYSCDPDISYRKDGQWHDGGSYSKEDLLRLKRLAGKAYDRIIQLEIKDKAALLEEGAQ